MTLLLDSALRATLILTAAWIAALLLRPASADLRNRIWRAAILAVALLPAALLLASNALPEAFLVVPPTFAFSSRAPQNAADLPWFLIVWAVGAVMMLVRLGAGVARVAQWTRSARLQDGLFYSADVPAPVTWGLPHSVILLPTYGMAHPELVIGHERAHIERRDWLWQMLAEVVTSVFWFHPLVWLASAELRREAERATDDRVLHSGAVPADYAAQLMEVARRLHTRVPLGATAMVRRPFLEGRVKAILDPARRRGRAGVITRSAIALMAAGLMTASAASHNGVHRVGEKGLTPPRVISKAEPAYTEEARAAKIQGKVVLYLEIDASGKARNMRVTKSLDQGLDQKAMEAISHWQFEPARKKGSPVRCAAVIEVNFRLM